MASMGRGANMAISPTNRARAPRSLSSTRVPQSSRSIGQRSLSMTRLGSRAPLPTPRSVSPRPPIHRYSPSPAASTSSAASHVREDLHGLADETQRLRKSSLDVMVLQYKIPKGTVFGLYQSPVNSPKPVSCSSTPTKFDRRISCSSNDSTLVKLHRNSKLNGMRQASPSTMFDHAASGLTIVGQGLSKEDSFRRHSLDDLLSPDSPPQPVGDRQHYSQHQHHHHRGSNHVPTRSSSDRIPSYSHSHSIPPVAKTGELPPASRRPVKRSMSVVAPRRPYTNTQTQVMMIAKSCQRVRYKTAADTGNACVEPHARQEPLSIKFESKKTTMISVQRTNTEVSGTAHELPAADSNCDVKNHVTQDNLNVQNASSVIRDTGNIVDDKTCDAICNIDDNVDKISNNTTDDSDTVITTRTDPEGGRSEDCIGDHETSCDKDRQHDAMTREDHGIDCETPDIDHDNILPSLCDDASFPEYAKYLTLPRRRSKYQSHMYREKFHSDQSNDSGYSDHILPNGSAFGENHGLVTIRMKPDSQGRFGFNVKGGADQCMPIIVSRVAPNTPADLCIPRLNEGDQVLYINGRDVSQHTHEQVVMFIRASRETHSGELELIVRPNAVYIGEDTTEEPDFQYIPDTHHITTSLPQGTSPLSGSLMLLTESLESGAALAQFEQLYRKKPGMTMNAAKLADNIPKNRYRDISPYDQTMVTVQGVGYVNANFVNMEIPGSGIINRYIAAQGPLPNTCADFWQMIWEQQCRLVAMLTTKVERGRVKCHQYWPDLYETIDYGHLQITCLREEQTPSFAFREFTLVNMEAGTEERHIRQMQYIAWPDHGVPEDSSDFLDFVIRVRQNRVGMVEPCVVHCSAGIGRTGVLITMETAMCLIEANQPVYPLDIVRQMRDQRAMLIQTASQYKFVCEAITKVYADKIVKPLEDYQR